jgi:hypothetical protein
VLNWGSLKGQMLPSGRKQAKGARPSFPDTPPPCTCASDLTANTLALGWWSDGEPREWKLLSIEIKDRAVHLYVAGASGSGKTKFLEFLIHQDILRGDGFEVISPHSGLILDVKGFLACVAEQTGNQDIFDRVVLVDPTDPKYTVVFKVLEPLPGVSHEKQAQEFDAVCKLRWGDSWGPRMESKFGHSLIALGEASLPLVFLPRFLTVQDFRREVLDKVSNPIVRADFESFDQLIKRQQLERTEPITNKVNQCLSDPRIYQMLAHPKSSFNLRDVMDSGKILLLSTDKGNLGDASSDLLNGLLWPRFK